MPTSPEQIVIDSVQPDEESKLQIKESKGWQKATGMVMQARDVSSRFATLRDMLEDVYIDSSRLQTRKILGAGAFATVEVADLSLPDGSTREVAVKRLKPDVLKGETGLKDFIQEMAILKKLKHKHIVDFVGVGGVRVDTVHLRSSKDDDRPLGPIEAKGRLDEMTGDRVFLVQELLEGGTLNSVLLKQMTRPAGCRYSKATALRFCLEIAKGLEYLHGSNPTVIHRDLKLENIMLKGDPRVLDDCTVKLTDFGLAAAVRSNRHLRGHRDSGSSGTSPPDSSHGAAALMKRLSRQSTGASEASYQMSGHTGSLIYMAPEVFLGKPYNYKVDVFSFAVVMWELFGYNLTLPAAAPRGTPAEVERYAGKVAEGFRQPIPGDWPEPLQELIRDCWSQSPKERPTMSQVVSKLTVIQHSPLFHQWFLERHPPAGCGCVIS